MKYLKKYENYQETQIDQYNLEDFINDLKEWDMNLTIDGKYFIVNSKKMHLFDPIVLNKKLQRYLKYGVGKKDFQPNTNLYTINKKPEVLIIPETKGVKFPEDIFVITFDNVYQKLEEYFEKINDNKGLDNLIDSIIDYEGEFTGKEVHYFSDSGDIYDFYEIVYPLFLLDFLNNNNSRIYDMEGDEGDSMQNCLNSCGDYPR